MHSIVYWESLQVLALNYEYLKEEMFEVGITSRILASSALPFKLGGELIAI